MLQVDLSPSDSGAAEPAVLWFGARRVDISAIVDRWYAPDRRWWKVATAEGEYIVRRDESTGEWDLAAVVGAPRDGV